MTVASEGRRFVAAANLRLTADPVQSWMILPQMSDPIRRWTPRGLRPPCHERSCSIIVTRRSEADAFSAVDTRSEENDARGLQRVL